MKKISQSEFELIVEDLIAGKTTLKKLCVELKTSYSSLNSKIAKLSEINPELYAKYIDKFPYKPKTNTQINASGIAIAIMKDDLTIESISVEYNIPKRTVNRKISSLKKENPELYEIYKAYRNNSKDKVNNEKIGLLLREPILKEKTSQELKQDEIKNILEQYENLLRENPKLSQEAAAAQLGYLPQQIFEMRKKLTRISKEVQFRNTHKVDVSLTSNLTNTNSLKNRELEGLEKE